MSDGNGDGRRSGILLMGFGGPMDLDEVGPFLTRLIGKEPSPELLERVYMKYLTIGGASPMPLIARDIAEKLRDSLVEAGHEVPIGVGMRYASPLIEEGLAALAACGVANVVTVSLSPFESEVTTQAYRDQVLVALKSFPGMELVGAPLLHKSQRFVEALSESVYDARSEMPQGQRTLMIFTAHSLPLTDAGLTAYVGQLESTVAALAKELDLGEPRDGSVAETLADIEAFGGDGRNPWLLAYQSKGERGGDWLGPDISEVLTAAAQADFDSVLVCPVGFVTEHLETLYDLDVVAAGQALDLGLEWTRVKAPNDRREMIAAIKELVEPLL